MAGALKIWDGTAWQTVSQQGPPGTAPVTSVDARTGAVTLSDLYVAKPGVTSVDGRTGAVSLSDRYVSATDPLVVTDDWIAYTPTMGTDQGSAGMTPGAGGFLIGKYRIVAPYTLAFRMQFIWGSSGGNGGTGSFIFGGPPGYTSASDTYQLVNGIAWPGDQQFLYPGIGHVYPSTSGFRAFCTFAGAPPDPPPTRWSGSMFALSSSNTPTNPVAWYPNGGCRYSGVINVQQRS